MSNPSRKKGSTWETELLPLLREIYPNAERAPLKGVHDHGDFVNVPMLIEAKKTDAPHFLEWARTATKKAGADWAIFWAGDRRKGDGPYVLVPMAKWLETEALSWQETLPYLGDTA